jgi:AcrR family transcriptional regulator
MTNLTERLSSTLSVRTEPVQLRSTERISKLLDAAAELIDEHGIDGLTTSDVAARSESSVGVVYRYFPNIQSLLRGLAARNMGMFTSRIFGAMTESSADWMVAMNSTIDVYLELVRTEPGFRALGFGDVIAKRFLKDDVSNNTVLAGEFASLFVEKYGLVPSEELSLDLEIVIEIADALLTRAFLFEKDGDERFVAKLRVIVYDHMAAHANPATR